jgi:hypothetical protein
MELSLTYPHGRLGWVSDWHISVAFRVTVCIIRRFGSNLTIHFFLFSMTCSFSEELDNQRK